MFKRSSRKDIIKFGSNSCYFHNLKVRSILSIGINKPTLIESSLFYWAWLFFFLVLRLIRDLRTQLNHPNHM